MDVRYASPVFAPLKVVGFVGLQSGILFVLATLAVFLAKAWLQREDSAEGE